MMSFRRLTGWLRSGFSIGLAREAKAHIPVLPLLRIQLEQTSAEMESSVVSVCGTFNEIASNARDSVKESTRAVGAEQETGAGLESALANSRTTIENLLERMERNSELSMRVVERMGVAEASLNGITRALVEIDKISFGNHMLALNAKIEAVHVGDKGAGFGVVADEIAAQARKSSSMTEQIEQTVQDLSRAMIGAAGELRALASADREKLAESRAEVRAALDCLGHAHETIRERLEVARNRQEQLAEDISRSVQTLQFQDRLSQRIGHVVTALDRMEKAFRGEFDGHDSPASAGVARHEKVLSDLRQSCTMEGERAVLEGGPVNVEDSSGDVELF